ncbi:MAG: aminotransferase class V-fold PLP-dependent enzyme [Coriobacteriia bacterium]|nr:aminotransferase class V-fold PLP-dependent enzyme [Coriobacteriia bacterium]
MIVFINYIYTADRKVGLKQMCPTIRKAYFDHSSTSVPKAPGVADRMTNYLDTGAYSIGRGGYAASLNIAQEILEARELIAELFNAADPREVIFTPSLTYALNIILSGFLREGDHVITTSMEHNSVMRPLYALKQQRGISYDPVQCDSEGALYPEDILPLIRSNTKAIVMTHASNVCGTVLPIQEVAKLCKQRDIRLIVDAAQTAGVLPIDASDIDALAFPGHKGLLGPTGIGGFIVKSDFAKQLNPILWGGTGSLSQGFKQPDFLPDKFESGTMNIAGILGLKAALAYLKEAGCESIYQHEMQLYEHFISEARTIKGMNLVGAGRVAERNIGVSQQAPQMAISEVSGSRDEDLLNTPIFLSADTYGQTSHIQKVPVVSMDFPHHDNANIAAALDKQYGIMARCGLHCAPAAHKTLGTFPQGTVRLSFGHANTLEEVDYLLESLKGLLSDGSKNISTTKGITHGV